LDPTRATGVSEQYRVAVEDLQDLDSGKKKMAEDTGQGWVDTTDRWRDRIRTEELRGW